MPAIREHLLHRLVVGDAAAIAAIVAASRTSSDPPTLVAAALFAADGDRVLERARALAASTRDRQLVAVAAAHLRGERELVDAVVAAVLGGAVTGCVLGTAQAWGMGSGGPPGRRWIAATTIGLAAGLAAGSAAVGYGTGIGDLVVQGAICGLAIGTAQALSLRGRAAYLWAPATSALWALGWAISSSIGIDVDTQWTVFGASGALVVTAASAALPALLATGTMRSAS